VDNPGQRVDWKVQVMIENADSRREGVQRLLNGLRSRLSQERLDAAKELRELGTRMRGAVRCRGVVIQPAAKPVEALDLGPAMQAINDAHWEVRREVALALGEWGDEIAVEVLRGLARNDSEWRVREAVAEALSVIGGPKAVDVLTHIVRTDPHPGPAERALKGLGDLALATWPGQLRPAPEASHGAVVTRGAVRVRGASPSRRINPQADAILALLDEMRFRHPDPSVRVAAADALARLDE